MATSGNGGENLADTSRDGDHSVPGLPANSDDPDPEQKTKKKTNSASVAFQIVSKILSTASDNLSKTSFQEIK